MKISNLARFFALGFLAALLLAGCSNPITGLSPASGEPPAELRADPLAEPFTVDIRIGTGSSARTVAGPSSDRIKAGLRNFIQLIVVDDQGNLAALVEDRRENAGDADWTLAIESLDFRKTYSFLLLMGYWKHNGNYVYDDTEKPTLLAAGYKEQIVEQGGTITMEMWPVVVDTEFTTANSGVPAGSRTTAPVVTNGKPGAVSLLPVDWGVTWTVKRGGTSGNGFENLIKAQQAVDEDAGEDLLVKSKQTILKAGSRQTAPVTTNTATGNGITAALGSYTSGITNIGVRGSVQFKLEYVPFNLTDGRVWAGYNGESKFNLDGKTPPVWIIRNGVNDEAQDSATDFTNFGKEGNAAANGNGAVAFVVAADEGDPQNPKAGDLVIKDAAFVGPSNLTTAAIKFTTEGYAGQAAAYYAVVAGGTAAPEYSAYTTGLGSFAAGTDHQGTVTLGTANGNYDVYVVLFKDGKVSAPVKLNTAGRATGVQLNKSSLVLGIGKQETLIATVLPAETANKTVRWSTGASGVATVSNGTVRGISAGKTTITVTTEDGGHTAACEVTVLPANMVFVAGGTFLMGSPENEPERDSRETQHLVTLSSFYISKYELSQEEYRLYDPDHVNYFNGDNLPVELVSWYDAVKYCNWLSEQAGLTPVYKIKDENITNGENVTWDTSANGYRLPTEAEWEYACRAGTTTAFNTGDNITTDQANYKGDAPYNGNGAGIIRGTTVAVDSFAPNAWGLYNMHGNLWEWCWDRYVIDYYYNKPAAVTNPVGPDTGAGLLRGGALSADGRALRSATRGFDGQAGKQYNTGFRLVCGALPQ
ncbi:MAG: SUMF1/EgtB/PvdO family nonheme iron enzyme [Spirochaetaceae bacterium]|jgi:formylglycine-generating enzyme required for sulfatase activity|nr:SUMF1/EgtB/PvdO family nonheme iron enzyme [Spirochaetaceae bacterium]